MNQHIEIGLSALDRGDTQEAVKAFTYAASDPDPLVQRIARNKLYDLHPETVYASTHSWKRLYHRENCPAKNVTWRSHIVRFRDWREAESCGFVPCSNCRPVRRAWSINNRRFEEGS